MRKSILTVAAALAAVVTMSSATVVRADSCSIVGNLCNKVNCVICDSCNSCEQGIKDFVSQLQQSVNKCSKANGNCATNALVVADNDTGVQNATAINGNTCTTVGNVFGSNANTYGLGNNACNNNASVAGSNSCNNNASVAGSNSCNNNASVAGSNSCNTNSNVLGSNSSNTKTYGTSNNACNKNRNVLGTTSGNTLCNNNGNVSCFDVLGNQYCYNGSNVLSGSDVQSYFNCLVNGNCNGVSNNSTKQNCNSNVKVYVKKNCNTGNNTSEQTTKKQTTTRPSIQMPTRATEKETRKPSISIPETKKSNIPETTKKPVQETRKTTVPEPTKAAPVSNEESTYVQQIVNLVNQERAKAGLGSVTLDNTLKNAAMTRAREIETSFSHTRPNGTSFSTVLAEYGISYRGSGENIAWGQASPQEVMNGWMNSSGHRANILNANYTKIGVGYYKSASGRKYWSQLFVY